MTEQVTNEAAVVAAPRNKRSVYEAMAERYGMEREAFVRILNETILPSSGDRNSTPAHVAAFLTVANEYQLNPMTKEIYAFPDRNGAIVPVVGVDGWVTLINRQPEMDGIEFDFIEEDEPSKNPRGVTCRIYRKDRSRPVEVTEWFSEVKRNTQPWKDMPRRMSRHKALIQCARIAFGISGIYDEDEARDIAEGDATVIESRPLSDIAPVENFDEPKTPDIQIVEPSDTPAEEPTTEEAAEALFQE